MNKKVFVIIVFFLDGCFLDGFFLNECFLDGCFCGLRASQKLIGILKTLDKLKLTLQQTPLGETGYLSNFLDYLSMPPTLHCGFSDL